MIKVCVRWFDSYYEEFECVEVRAGNAYLWMRLADGRNRQIPLIQVRWFSQTPESHSKIENEDKAIKILDFAEWVTREIFDDMWEYNKDAFSEIACRELEKLGIVREENGEWVKCYDSLAEWIGTGRAESEDKE